MQHILDRSNTYNLNSLETININCNTTNNQLETPKLILNLELNSPLIKMNKSPFMIKLEQRMSLYFDSNLINT